MQRSRRERLQRITESAVIVAAVATVPLLLGQRQDPGAWWVVFGDWVVWAIFLAEFVVVVSLATDKRAAARANWSSIAITVISFPLLPALFAASRLVRLTRLVRLLRVVRLGLVASRGLHALRAMAGRHELLYITGTALFLVLIGAGVLTVAEPERGGFWDSLWWAAVTVTTVGYGDISPTTPVGRIAAVILMVVGIGVIATLAASMASYFVHDDSDSERAALVERLDRIETMLAELVERQSHRDATTHEDSARNYVGLENERGTMR